MVNINVIQMFIMLIDIRIALVIRLKHLEIGCSVFIHLLGKEIQPIVMKSMLYALKLFSQMAENLNYPIKMK